MKNKEKLIDILKNIMMVFVGIALVAPLVGAWIEIRANKKDLH